MLIQSNKNYLPVRFLVQQYFVQELIEDLIYLVAFELYLNLVEFVEMLELVLQLFVVLVHQLLLLAYFLGSFDHSKRSNFTKMNRFFFDEVKLTVNWTLELT